MLKQNKYEYTGSDDVKNYVKSISGIGSTSVTIDNVRNELLLTVTI